MAADISLTKVLVTGGSGFVGLHTILHLLQMGYCIRTTVRAEAQENNVRKTISDQIDTPRLEFARADLLKIEVLSRPHIQQKYHIQSSDIIALINLIRLRGELVSPQQKIDACLDTADNIILEAAIAGAADVIVSGDADLLDLTAFESLPILRVAMFLTQF